MTLLSIRSRSTLTEYCNLLGIMPGIRYFTQEEIEKLQELRSWCKRGGRKAEYRKYQVAEE